MPPEAPEMNQSIEARLELLEKKLDETFVMTRKTYRFIMAGAIASVLLFVLPLIGLLFAIPSFISTYSSMGAITSGL